VSYRELVRTPRLVLAVLALVFLALASFHAFRNVSATAVAGGPTWPCGSVARPSLPSSDGIAAATPDSGRQAFLFDQVACAAARDRQLGRMLTSLLPALVFGIAFVALGRRRRSAIEEPKVSVAA
jgi:hypothetical protein